MKNQPPAGLPPLPRPTGRNRYCILCGAAAEHACGGCRAIGPRTARFGDACGSVQAAAPAPPFMRIARTIRRNAAALPRPTRAGHSPAAGPPPAGREPAAGGPRWSNAAGALAHAVLGAVLIGFGCGVFLGCLTWMGRAHPGHAGRAVAMAVSLSASVGAAAWMGGRAGWRAGAVALRHLGAALPARVHRSTRGHVAGAASVRRPAISSGKLAGIVAADGLAIAVTIAVVMRSGMVGAARGSAPLATSAASVMATSIPAAAGLPVRAAADAAPAAARTTTATQHPTAAKTTAELKRAYAPLVDVEELVGRAATPLGKKWRIDGTVTAIFAPGRKMALADGDPKMFAALIQIGIAAPNGGVAGIVVGFNGDASTIARGSRVTVYGAVLGTHAFVDAVGARVAQPLIDAQFVDVGAPSGDGTGLVATIESG